MCGIDLHQLEGKTEACEIPSFLQYKVAKCKKNPRIVTLYLRIDYQMCEHLYYPSINYHFKCKKKKRNSHMIEHVFLTLFNTFNSFS